MILPEPCRYSCNAYEIGLVTIRTSADVDDMCAIGVSKIFDTDATQTMVLM